MKVQGFLFDLDGTLVDSLQPVERAWSNWAQNHHLNVQEVLAYIHGKQAITSLRHFLPQATETQLQAELAEMNRIESTDVAGIVPLPGVNAFMDRIHELQVPWAIVTSGAIPVATARHRAAGLPMPKVFITADQIKHGKPAPDPYLLGAEKLGFAPQACAVFEDAPSGVASGLAANCPVVAVNLHSPIPELERVTIVAESFEQLWIEPLGDGWFDVIQR